MVPPTRAAAPGGGDVLPFRQGVGAETGRRIAFFRRDQVDQPVRASQARGFGGRAWRCRCPCRERPGAESTLTRSTGNRSARARAAAVLPAGSGAHEGGWRGQGGEGMAGESYTTTRPGLGLGRRGATMASLRRIACHACRRTAAFSPSPPWSPPARSRSKPSARRRGSRPGGAGSGWPGSSQHDRAGGDRICQMELEDLASGRRIALSRIWGAARCPAASIRRAWPMPPWPSAGPSTSGPTW